MNLDFFAKWGAIYTVFIVAWFVFVILLQVILAISVYNDAEKVQDEGIEIQLFPVIIWALATLIGGIFVAVAYWVIHRSMLNIENQRTLNKEKNYVERSS